MTDAGVAYRLSKSSPSARGGGSLAKLAQGQANYGPGRKRRLAPRPAFYVRGESRAKVTVPMSPCRLNDESYFRLFWAAGCVSRPRSSARSSATELAKPLGLFRVEALCRRKICWR